MRCQNPILSASACGLAKATGDDSKIKVISTDVFDTLLLRNGKSQRSRIVEAEAAFEQILLDRDVIVPRERLIQARLLAQRLAFRALSVGGGGGEVRLVDVIERQLALLGIPSDFAPVRLEAEMDVERRCLSANRRLLRFIGRQRERGRAIVAVSDTMLPADRVMSLIEHVCGQGVVDRVYSSADELKSKRNGELFVHLIRCENAGPGEIFHAGDDRLADVTMPSAKGIKTCHLPRARARRFLSLADAGLTEIARRLRAASYRASSAPRATDAVSFGRNVLGPLVAEFCVSIWLYARQAQTTDKAVLLFCARGGIGIRQAFECTLRALSLSLDVRRENLLISRLVAARAAVLTNSSEASEELAREFRSDRFADVARALGGGDYDLPAAWQNSFAPQDFYNLLNGHSGRQVLQDIRAQNELFRLHFAELVDDADRIILCDTGLYGSTQRLLQAAFPDLRIETIQFARSNYKGHGEEHFPKVVGLVVERNTYSPMTVETCVLRYWHLIESLFEPAVGSVRSFKKDASGRVTSNAGDVAFGSFSASVGNRLLTGAMQYLDRIPSQLGGSSVLCDADIAWRRLKQAITRPTEDDLKCLEVGARSVDFGRSGTVQVIIGRRSGFIDQVRSIKAQLWREGKIARDFPRLKPVLLLALEGVHTIRGLSGHLGR